MSQHNEETEGLLKKVKKLLALASSPNEHEAKSAAEKAQAIMVKHNLSIQALGKASDYEIGSTGHTQTKICRESSYIMSILTQHFFVRCYFDTEFAGYTKTFRRKHTSTARIVGTNANVEVAKYVYEYLLFTYRDLWKKYKAENGLDESSKISYFQGLTSGIKESLKANEKKVSDEMGLVIVPDAKIKEFMNERLKLKSRSVSATRVDHSAQAAGHEQGKKVKIARALESGSSNSGLALGYRR